MRKIRFWKLLYCYIVTLGVSSTAHRLIGSSEFRRMLKRIIFGLRERKKSMEEIFFKMLLRKKYFRVVGLKLNIDFWTV